MATTQQQKIAHLNFCTHVKKNALNLNTNVEFEETDHIGIMFITHIGLLRRDLQKMQSTQKMTVIMTYISGHEKLQWLCDKFGPSLQSVHDESILNDSGLKVVL